MKKRPLGRTGLEVSEIGFGTWPLSDAGWGRLATDEEAVELIHAAHDLGCNFFDTAPQFGAGRSEMLLGRALRGERRGVLICGKFGRLTDGSRDFSVARLRPSLEASLERLAMREMDLLLLDSPSQAELGRSQELFGALEGLKREGRIRAWGVSVDDLGAFVQAVESGPIQVAEVRFNLLFQDPAEVFGQAAKRGIGLVARNPLDSGWLGGCYTAATRFHGLRARWTPENVRRRAGLVEKFSTFLSQPGTGLAQASLQFVLAHPEVSCALPGIRDALQLDYDVSACSSPLAPAKLEQAREAFFREIKGNPLPD
jgi:aryl-alcohol dehydrogenase-like predicted oxidoreductase